MSLDGLGRDGVRGQLVDLVSPPQQLLARKIGAEFSPCGSDDLREAEPDGRAMGGLKRRVHEMLLAPDAADIPVGIVSEPEILLGARAVQYLFPGLEIDEEPLLAVVIEHPL